MKKPLSDAEYAALAEFRHSLRRFLAFSEAQARAAGLNPQQHQLLLAVRGFAGRPPTVGELAERLVVRHHSAVELVDRLESKRMVTRQRSEADRRLARVVLTARGADVLQKLSLSHRDELRRTGPELARALLSISNPSTRRKKSEPSPTAPARARSSTGRSGSRQTAPRARRARSAAGA